MEAPGEASDHDDIDDDSLESVVEERRSRTLTERLRLVAMACIAVSATLMLVSLVGAGGVWERIPQFRLASLLAASGFLAASYRPAFVPRQKLWGWCLLTTISALAAMGATDRSSADLAAILEASILLLAASLLPWGHVAQGASVLSCAAILSAVLWALGPFGADHPALPVVVVGSISFLLSLFVARVTRSAFDAAAFENLRLQSARKRIRAQADELRATLADQREMTRAISHDLRQPLRHIGGYARMLLDDLEARLDPDDRARLARICTASLRMDQMVDDLLEISRVAATPVERKELDLAGLCLEVADLVQRSEPGRVVDLVVEPGLRASGDPKLVRTLLLVLLDNAWKFTRGREPAVVRVGRAGDAYFVRDNGSGFDMLHASKLFVTFERLHHVDEFEGEGVGLTIAQRVVRRHGGRIWAESEPGQGATFYFTLGPGGDGKARS